MPSCPRCSAANDEGRLRCAQCGAAFSSTPLGTPKPKVPPQAQPQAAKPPSPATKRRGPVLTTSVPAAEALARDRAGPNDQTGPIERPMLVPPPGGKKRASSTALPALPPASPAPAGPVVLAYLVSTVLENPFELRSTGSCEIGRGDENDIVLPVHQVSRQHALIKWDGDSFAIIDRGSTNGIYVNGEPVKRKRLQVGDLIGIGPFDMTFQETIDAGQAPKQEETVVVTTPGSFAGELSDVSVSEVCQLIDLNQKTGILDFHYGDRRGKVYFEKGQATHAEYRELIADNAALELLSLTRGSFRFIAKESVTVQRTIKRPTASLLLEAARRADESK